MNRIRSMNSSATRKRRTKESYLKQSFSRFHVFRKIIKPGQDILTLHNQCSPPSRQAPLNLAVKKNNAIEQKLQKIALKQPSLNLTLLMSKPHYLTKFQKKNSRTSANRNTVYEIHIKLLMKCTAQFFFKNLKNVSSIHSTDSKRKQGPTLNTSASVLLLKRIKTLMLKFSVSHTYRNTIRESVQHQRDQSQTYSEDLNIEEKHKIQIYIQFISKMNNEESD